MHPGAIASLVALLFAAGCATKRPPGEPAELLARRAAVDLEQLEIVRDHNEALLAAARREQQEHAAGRRAAPAAIDVLIISGGGDWGAFGAGFLRGWNGIPSDHPLAKPRFDIVTGVSTGALIAPFAFLGDDASLQVIESLYRNPGKDWVLLRGPLYFMPTNISFAKLPGLERELRETVDLDLVTRIAQEGGDGRLLAVNTTNLDAAAPQGFDLVAEAELAVRTGSLDRLHSVMLASAGIPGAFPYREIDGQMFVDGGVTANIIYGGRLGEEDSLPAIWQRLYPGEAIPTIRFWIIFNNKLRATPTVVEPRWPAIVTRSLELSTRSATITAIRHLHAMAEISRLKRGAEVEVRLVAIPDDWDPPVAGAFMRQTMNELADLGARLGADPGSWISESP